MKKNKVISDWLDKYGDTEIDKKVEMKLEEMNKEQIIDEVYKNYEGKRQKWEIGRVGEMPKLSKEEFINKCKTDPEFSEKWGLEIEERELSLEERKSIYEKEYTDGMEVPNNNWLNSKLTTRNIPTKLITITYIDKKIKSYE